MSEFQYQLIRSGRRTLALEIRGGALIVRAPWHASTAEIERLLREKESWIRKHLSENLRRQEQAKGIQPLTREELRELADRAAQYIPGRVRFYAGLLGVRVRRITIRSQRTRWGSCSAQGNLNFNCLLMLTPPEVIDSVVVHELCHLIEMNHSDRFYREVLRIYPDYYKWQNWLKEHRTDLMARLG